jgi:hypothetical protein
MLERRLIIRCDDSVRISNNIDQEIVIEINRARFHKQAPAHIRIMHANRNGKTMITAIMHPNASAEMAPQYHNIIITGARTVNNGVMDVEENDTLERPKNNAVPLIRHMGKGTAGMQKSRDEFQVENDGLVIPSQVMWQPHPHTIRESREN